MSFILCRSENFSFQQWS